MACGVDGALELRISNEKDSSGRQLVNSQICLFLSHTNKNKKANPFFCFQGLIQNQFVPKICRHDHGTAMKHDYETTPVHVS